MAREVTVWPGLSLLLSALVSSSWESSSIPKGKTVLVSTPQDLIHTQQELGWGQGVGLEKGCRRREQTGDRMDDMTLMWEMRTETVPTGGRHLPCLTAVPEFCDGGHQMRWKVCKIWGRGESKEGKGEPPNLTALWDYVGSAAEYK